MKLPERTELHGWRDELQGATSADHRSASTLRALLLKNISASASGPELQQDLLHSEASSAGSPQDTGDDEEL